MDHIVAAVNAVARPTRFARLDENESSDELAANEKRCCANVIPGTVAGNGILPYCPSTTTTDLRRDVSGQELWLPGRCQQHPGVQPLVQRVIAPMRDATLTDMAAQGMSLTL